MQDFVVIYEQGETSWGAYVPYLPGCVAVGDSREEVETLISGAITMHLKTLQDFRVLFMPADDTQDRPKTFGDLMAEGQDIFPRPIVRNASQRRTRLVRI